ncbi:MAG: hypothetical protein JKY66_03215 [Spongiibacteraceae bacterium]|nr:hypothetical protein [Spongiibacteraceae bacterium]
MDLQNWLNSAPDAYPILFEKQTPFQNPLIQDSQESTIKAVHDVTQLLIDMALPWPGDETFSLSKDSTWGYINILLCITGALAFEHRYRPGGGEPTEDAEETKQEDMP